jgi:trans-L-3-hydroxyproline dehydratase
MNGIFEGRVFGLPAKGTRIETVDMHTGGEPVRIVTGGLPEIKGSTLLEKRQYFKDHLDHIRRALMWEPRGHSDMYGVVMLDPVAPGTGLSVLFLHNDGYSTMCGHATIALARFLRDAGLIGKDGPGKDLILEVPAGLVKIVQSLGDKAESEGSFLNVPSFVLSQGLSVHVEDIGPVRFDIAYGGAFYALVDAADLGLKLVPRESTMIRDLGTRIKLGISGAFSIEHPVEKELGFLYGVIFTGEAHHEGHHSRNVCIFANGELDRSATGSGVSARAALLHAMGELKTGVRVTIESILGTDLSVEVIGETDYFGYRAVIPKVSGQAFYTGRHVFLVEEDDPLGGGFLIN